jgi:hypothetical protein
LLFGRLTGKFRIQPHYRGNETAGSVVKTYELRQRVGAR